MQTAAVLNVMIQGDFVPMRAEQQGLGGISECWTLTHTVASSPSSPQLYPPRAVVSEPWDFICNLESPLMWFCCVREAKTEKWLQCFQCVAHLAGATRCWCSSRCYFEYWTSLLLCTCSSRLAAVSENANEADIQHQPSCVRLPLTHFCQRPTNQ